MRQMIYWELVREVPRVRDPTMDPKHEGSCYKDTDKQDPPIYRNSLILGTETPHDPMYILSYRDVYVLNI